MEEFTEQLWAGLVPSTPPALARPHHDHGPEQPTTGCGYGTHHAVGHKPEDPTIVETLCPLWE